MDARTAATAAGLCLLALTAGCSLQTGSLAADRRTGDSPAPVGSDAPATVAEAGDLQTVADAQPDMEPVRRWVDQIERIDDLGTRVARELDGKLNPLTEITYGQSPTLRQQLPGSVPADPTDAPPSVHAGADSTTGQQISSPQRDTAPVLGAITVRAAPSATPTPRPTGVNATSVNAPEHAARQPLTIQEFTEQWLAYPADTSFRSQLDRHLLAVLGGEYEAARRPLEMVSTEQQQMASQFVEALIAIREGHGGDPGAEANRVLARIEALLESLVPLSDLQIPTLALSRAVHGFGRYEVFDPPRFLSGRESEFVIYCEVRNFLSRVTDDGSYESLFSMRTTVLNRAGDVVLEINDEHIADKCRTRRHDCFIPRLVRLPATLSPGEYVVKMTIIDKIGEKVAEKRTTFRIVARS